MGDRKDFLGIRELVYLFDFFVVILVYLVFRGSVLVYILGREGG